MALSNIFYEPIREINETTIGILLFIPFVLLDYYISTRIVSVCGGGTSTPPCEPFWAEFLLIVPILFVVIAFLTIVLCVFIHSIGETFCDWLEDDFDIYLRPRNRK